MEEFVPILSNQEKKLIKPKNSLFVLVTGLTVGLVLLIGYFKFFSGSSLPQNFIVAYQVVDSTTKAILGSYNFNFSQLSSYGKNHDVEGALKLIADGLSQNIQNSQRMGKLVKETVALKSQQIDSSNQALSDKAAKLYSLIDQRNAHISSYLSNQEKVLTALKKFYEAGEGAKLEIDIDQLLTLMQQDFGSINELNFQIDATYQDLLKIAGVNTDEQQANGAFIQLQLRTTPEIKPTVQYSVPTIPPTPTIAVEAPTATPAATSIPTPVLTLSPAATSSAH